MPETLKQISSLKDLFYVHMSEILKKIISRLSRILKEPHSFKSSSDLHAIAEDIYSAEKYFATRKIRRSNINVAGVINSNISATGNIVIRGKGCFNSNVSAGGSVRINGVLRGGRVIAGGNVLIGEAGTEIGVKTIIEAGEKGLIWLGKCYEGVVVKIGKQSKQLIGKNDGVLVKLDNSGVLRIYNNQFFFAKGF